MARSAGLKRVRRPRVWGGAVVLGAGLGLSVGFIGVVFSVAHESSVALPDGVRAGNYVTLGRREAESGSFSTVSTVDFREIVGATPEVQWSYGSYYTEEAEIVDSSGAARRVEVRRVSAGFMSLLGVAPVLGTVAAGGDAAVAVVGAQAWRELLAGDPDVIGESVTVEGTPVPVIGVADPAFVGLFGSRPDLWILDAGGSSSEQDGSTTVAAGLYMFGRLGGDATPAALESLLAGHRFPFAVERDDRVEVVAGLELRPDLRREVRERLGWLAMVVALLLVLALVGLVDFISAAHAVREDGQGIRLAVGATPGDVFWESAARHGQHGLWIGGLGLASFLYFRDLLIGMEPFASSLGKLTAASSAIGLCASAMVMASAFLWSCWLTGRTVSRRSLITGGTSARTRRRSRLAWTALLFTAAASLLIGVSIGSRFAMDSMTTLGFAQRDTLMAGVLYANGRTPAALRRVRDILVAAPAVTASARSELLPLLSESVQPTNRARVVVPAWLAERTFYRNRVDAPFFDVLGVELLAGSFLDGRRTREAVLSRRAAALFAGEVADAVGMTVELALDNAPGRGDVLTVVGVVEDVPYGGLEEPPRAVVYTSRSDADAAVDFHDLWVIRHEGGADEVVGLLHRLGGEVAEAYRIGTPEGILAEQFEKRSVDAVLALAGGFAFVLAVAGVAGALARTVAHQSKQVGVRYALGATRADETRRIAGDALTDLLLAGAVLCAVVFAGRLFAPELVEVVTLPLVALVLVVVGGVCLLASFLSVRRLAGDATATALAGR